MKINKVALLLILCLPMSIFAQKTAKEPVIFCFGKNKVYQNEVERGYLRNKDVANDKPTSQDVDDYLQLYQNFKLKVQDAKDRKLDTMPEYINELAQYRSQLAKKYLNDSAVTEELIAEAYDRYLNIVNASHILILSKSTDAPADTLKAFEKLAKIRADLAAEKITFEQAALDFSEDPSANQKGRLGYLGNLGWFSAFQFLYEFEDMAYKTAIDEISPIFKTRFGYHILKVNDKKASEGERKISAIKIYRRPNGSAEDTMNVYERLQAVYGLLQKGEGWDSTLAKYTEDQNARYNYGVTDWFMETTDKLPEAVVKETYELTAPNQISKPIYTENAYYIIKYLDARPIPSFKEKEYEIRSKVSQDSRIYKSTKATTARIKKEHNFKENPAVLQAFITQASAPLVAGNWDTKNLQNGKQMLYSIGDETFTLDTFSRFVEFAQRGIKDATSGEVLINNLYKSLIDQTVLNYEDRNLEKNYPEFANVYQDFRDGILFFNINSQEVWNKPMTDTAGMRAFYNSNKDSFVWDDRLEMLTINAASDEFIDQAFAMLKKGIAKDSVMKVINASNPLNIFIERGLYEKGMNKDADNIIIKQDEWNESNPYISKKGLTNGVYKAFVGQKIIKKEAKPFADARGELSAMYQKKVEAEWLDGLRKKYKIKVNKKGYAAFKTKMLAL